MRRPKLTDDQIAGHLPNLPGWKRVGEAIVKQYTFPDFARALEFVNRVGRLAEGMDHHPDIDIRYNKVTLRLTTHDAGGLTQNDSDLAAASDEQAGAAAG